MRKATVKVSKNVKVTKGSLFSLFMYVTLLGAMLYPFTLPPQAHATVTESFVRFDRLETGAAISGTACIETSTVGTETNVTIVFPVDWTISQTAGNWTISTTNLPTDAAGAASTAWPNIDDADGTGGGVNGQSVTFGTTGSGDLANDTTFYCFNFAGASSTVGAAGNDKTGQLKTEGGSPFVDTVDWATSVVSSGGDQITVTASVSASMTFSLSGNSVDLGTLSTSSESYDSTGITQTVATNARNGWISWVDSANAGLDSASASDSIDSAAWTTTSANIVDMASVAGYVLDVVPGTGTPTVTAEYDGDGNSSGGNLDTQFRQTASNSGVTAGDTVVLHAAARAATTNAAASDYTDTLTVVAAGSF